MWHPETSFRQTRAMVMMSTIADVLKFGILALLNRQHQELHGEGAIFGFSFKSWEQRRLTACAFSLSVQTTTRQAPKPDQSHGLH